MRALLHPSRFTSSRWQNVPREGRLRSVGCKGSRPRCAAMYILRITGCLSLRCLSCCSRARGSCGGICRRTDTHPCRRGAFCIRVPLPCGRTQGRLCAYSYSISIIVCCPWFVSNSPTHPSYLVESVVEYPPLRLRSASRCTKGICLFIFYHYRLRLHLARRVGQDVRPSLPIVVRRDGSPQPGGAFIGERLVILYQYLWFVHIVPSAPPGYTQGYAVG